MGGLPTKGNIRLRTDIRLIDRLHHLEAVRIILPRERCRQIKGGKDLRLPKQDRRYQIENLRVSRKEDLRQCPE
ncbi:MAG: hypothetical protein GX786_00160, partial [Clostridiales bacterium]|nr:hypothetical protein [Clostridiales bacterium]